MKQTESSRGAPALLSWLKKLTEHLRMASHDLPSVSFYGFRVGMEILILVSLLISFFGHLSHLDTNILI